MTLSFVFSSDELKPARVDEAFSDQADALREAGFDVWTAKPDERKFATRGDDPAGHTIVYRGWMLTEGDYQTLAEVVEAKGASLHTSLSQYLATHHIPGWYQVLSDLTPETVFLPSDCDLEAELRSLGWDAFFLKDYVKSLKTHGGSLVRNASAAADVAEKMIQFRGQIEGGFSVRRVETYREGTESRYFVRDGRAFGPTADTVPQIVDVCAERLSALSPFFSVDIAEREDGTLRVVEAGDGQVSDLVGWSVERFVEMWRSE